MTKWICALFTFAFVAALAPFDAEARRLGGGKPIGIQRQAAPDRPAAAPAATPAQQTAPAAAAGGTAGAAKPGMGRWLAPLAGLAAGLGLAYLLGDQLGSFVMALLIGVLLVAAVTFLMRRFGKPQGQAAGPQGCATRPSETRPSPRRRPRRRPAGRPSRASARSSRAASRTGSTPPRSRARRRRASSPCRPRTTAATSKPSATSSPTGCSST